MFKMFAKRLFIVIGTKHSSSHYTKRYLSEEEEVISDCTIDITL